ncbi:MAG: AAA family ATPase [Acidobacteriaceae bacterium]
MQLSRFQIRNYKCFLDSGPIRLSPGMNVITGQNSAGKTALLQSLGLDFQGVPHRSTASLPNRGEPANKTSQADFTIAASSSEVEEFSGHRSVVFTIPNDPRQGQESLESVMPYFGAYQVPGVLERVWGWLLVQKRFNFALQRAVTQGQPGVVSAPKIPSHNLFVLQPGVNHTLLHRRPEANGTITYMTATGGPTDLGQQLADEFLSRIYRFSAERFNVGDAPTGTATALAPNASNLPEVLGVLQPNSFAWEEYVSLVREVLPQIKWISVDLLDRSTLRVRVWPIERSTKRDDLAMPLAECGTGTGQILAMLYVAYNSVDSRVILIDEPQSFLHPGAARKLIEVLKRFPQHQYIISTHSPSIIRAADAPELIILRSSEGHSSVEIADASATHTARVFLDEVGARLADVFGMDRIIWVEGATEQNSFPLLLKKMDVHQAGTAIVGIRNTGDLQGRDAKKIFEIYRNLSGKASLLPPTVAFVLDSETRSEDEKRELISVSDGKVRFLPRRTFENYLLDTDAISAIVNEIPGFLESGKVEAAEIERWFNDHAQSEKYWIPLATPAFPLAEFSKINAPAFLRDLFGALSDQRIAYRKIEHSVALFDWLLANKWDALSELATFLKETMGVS